MTSEVWQAESEMVTPLEIKSRGGIRQLYIECLENLIEKLKKEDSYAAAEKNSLVERRVPVYVLPTVIFADFYQPPASDAGCMRMTCYRDRRVFLNFLEQEEGEEDE